VVSSRFSRLLLAAVAIAVSAFSVWLALMEIFIAGFQPIEVDHGVGRAMTAREVGSHSLVAVVAATAAFAGVWWAVKLVAWKREPETRG
jgi:hypothetical protein